MRARWLFLAVPLLFLVSCDTPTETTDSTDQNFRPIVPLKQSCYDPDDPLCLPGPAPDDPNPNAPGYYIGPDYNMDHCTQSNDLDDDGFDDNCEYRIARRFAPLLATNPGDETSREPYWVARYEPYLPLGGGAGVEIMYLFGYHRDYGDGLFGDAHSGDSEFVVLRVVFDEASEHWMLHSAFYAAHHNSLGSELFGPSDFEGLYYYFQYPDNVDRGYPRVWVANDKHASYRSKRACNGGAVADADDCSYNYDDERIEVYKIRNIGSATNRFYNCVYSDNPISYQGTECFWNLGYKFCGWDLDRTHCATPYADVLREFGFGGFAQ